MVFHTLEFLSQQKEKSLSRKNANQGDQDVEEEAEAEMLLLDDIAESENIDLADSDGYPEKSTGCDEDIRLDQ